MKKIFIFPLLCVFSFMFSFIFSEFENNHQSDIAIFFIHKSNSWYLQHSFWQAKQYNQRVILLGDETNNTYQDLGVEHYHMNLYFESANAFELLYKHFSKMSYQYELFCFQRWFILKEFMEKEGISICFYCDSDALLYTNCVEEYIKYNYPDFALVISQTGGCSGHFSYWTLPALTRFCQFVENFYADQAAVDFWSKWYFDKQKAHKSANVCDMTLLKLFEKFVKDNMFFTCHNLKSIAYDSLFENNFSEDDGGVFLKQIVDGIGVKKISWINNQPYCWHKKMNKNIRLSGIHFQGSKKKLMKKYCRERVIIQEKGVESC